jgi:glucose-6-phosphate 1-dehydrogenase
VTDIFYEDNPLREGSRLRRTPQPSTVVIFGASGDLTHRKLVPSLYRLFVEGLLPGGFSILGFARREWSDDAFRESIREGLDRYLGEPVQEQLWSGFAQGLFFCPGQFDQRDSYTALGEALARVDGARAHTGNRVYYLAAPPSTYTTIISGLGEAGLGGRRSDAGWARIVVEKPFGRDEESARRLNAQLQEWFFEEQVYRIDHYLGKETVQNILVFRLANGIFEPVWNRQYVDHVQITVAEDIGVEGRGHYYEEAGALRDMIQNHVLQLLSLVAMEPPATFDAESVRDEKIKVLRALRPLVGRDVDASVIRGQYAPGFSRGENVAGYRQEPEVSSESDTETFVALRLLVDNWRWAGVPFYLRSGKRLPKRVTEIAIQFKQPPLQVFGRDAAAELEPNLLAFRIQPDEGIALKFGSKVPGPIVHIHPVSMDFRYGSSFGVRVGEAYERLLLDCLLGDSTLFNRDDAVEASWAFVDAIRDRWETERPALASVLYPAGTWGPPDAEKLIERDGRQWRRL